MLDLPHTCPICPLRCSANASIFNGEIEVCSRLSLFFLHIFVSHPMPRCAHVNMKRAVYDSFHSAVKPRSSAKIPE